MKRKLIALICALLIAVGALAESPAPTPEAAEEIALEGSLSMVLDGQSLMLEFDPDPLQSICLDGYIQASFFAYAEDGMLYELYLTFPQNIAAGETLSPESCAANLDWLSGVFLYISDDDSYTSLAATQFLTGAYPESSDYAMRFTESTAEGTYCTFEGTLEATLCEVDDNFNPTSSLCTLSAEFRFAMECEGSHSPSSDDAPASLPEDSLYPPTAPSKLVTPEDARKI